jgi:type II secretory pathway pseudopilin PulG
MTPRELKQKLKQERRQRERQQKQKQQGRAQQQQQQQQKRSSGPKIQRCVEGRVSADDGGGDAPSRRGLQQIRVVTAGGGDTSAPSGTTSAPSSPLDEPVAAGGSTSSSSSSSSSSAFSSLKLTLELDGASSHSNPGSSRPCSSGSSRSPKRARVTTPRDAALFEEAESRCASSTAGYFAEAHSGAGGDAESSGSMRAGAGPGQQRGDGDDDTGDEGAGGGEESPPYDGSLKVRCKFASAHGFGWLRHIGGQVEAAAIQRFVTRGRTSTPAVTDGAHAKVRDGRPAAFDLVSIPPSPPPRIPPCSLLFPPLFGA